MARLTKAPAAPTPEPEDEAEDRPLEMYGLEALGFEVPNLGSWLADQIDIETTAYRIGHTEIEGGLGKFGHFKQLVDLLWNNPSLKGRKKFVWNSWAERMLRSFCENDEVGVAGCASAGKSGPAALWAVVNYMVDPTHTLVLVMSTSLQGAKKRIWKYVMEYWRAIPDLPGKLLAATSEIRGLNFDWETYGDTSGMFLLATEKSSEASAMDKLIGIKAPTTGAPGRPLEELLEGEFSEFAPMVQTHGKDRVADLISRLQTYSEDRIGKIIVIVDEATGAAEGVLNALMANMKPGNEGHVQIIFLGNPASHFDSFGLFCQPEVGWENVTVADEEWETKSGGVCIRFNAENNPRITEGDEKLSWMPTKKAIEAVAKEFGKKSLYYYRMILGFWSPGGLETGVYSEADFIATGAMSEAPTIWGFTKPIRLSSFDPSFSVGGDRASCSFWSFGTTPSGVKVLHLDEEIPILVDITNPGAGIPTQMVRGWRRECEKRGVDPANACFDATGGGITFADLVKLLWSAQVQSISSGGKASKEAATTETDENGELVLASERYANKATQIWYGAHPFLRSGQIRGVSRDLAKEICSRQHEKGNHGDARTLKVENKRLFKAREKKSPDASDSFFLGIEHARTRHGFKPDTGSVSEAVDKPRGSNTWRKFVTKARRITTKRGLSR